jgi:hypothetical protein
MDTTNPENTTRYGIGSSSLTTTFSNDEDLNPAISRKEPTSALLQA